MFISLLRNVFVSQLSIEYHLVVCTILSTIGAAIGYVGFKYPDYSYIPISVWGAYTFTNLLHVVIGATDSTNYRGLGEYSWILYIIALLVYLLYFTAESAYYDDAQNIMCAFTCAYGSVAGMSFLLKYYILVPHSPFDILSFLNLPIQFRWNDPVSVVLLLLIILITLCGFLFSKYRSQGFFDIVLIHFIVSN